MYDLIIIGSGAAGLSAAIYAKRANLKSAVIEKESAGGGQILNTEIVDNYLGFTDISGYDISVKFREHAEKYNVEFIKNEVMSINNNVVFKEIVLKDSKIIKTKAVIIACGVERRKLYVKGENLLGVSYCAACDGALYTNKIAAVVGGGDAAFEDAIMLSGICKKVYLINRSDKFRSAKILQENVFKTKNIEVICNSIVEKINGKDKAESITIKNNITGKASSISVDGIFIAIGLIPETKRFENTVKCDKDGYIIADETGLTSEAGIFAAGDIRTKALRQLITAAADGANAVYSAEKYLKNQ